MEDDNNRIAITVCGDGGTGKSSISLRLVRSKWTHDYDPTIEDSYSVTRVIDGMTYHLHLTDTAGQEEYRGLWSAANTRDADAFLLVYDITNHDSLLAVDYFNDLIDMESEERAANKPPQIKFVAGNKVDLAHDRQVPSAEGLNWARDHGCGFMETSARNMVNIEETFALIVRRVVAARRGQLSPPTRQPNIPNSGLQNYPTPGDNDEKGQIGSSEDSKKKGFWKKLPCCAIM
ncbi:hypothetical protein H072_2564 [Dactylellina haptotyla CBS 200.50]|uniref:Ras-domain-containing protein n=1 Tax=Dactylellina haptotyla (strain CBS 200.50) TaxID=1284197 RepID=S8C6W3_DACHA|nr:hypothetical protein H072_2564 [Dactylellina haptotyla CBS 200.50]